LDSLGVERVEDIANLSLKAIANAKNCGRKTLNEILEWATLHQVPLEGRTIETGAQKSVDRDSIDSLPAMPKELLLRVSDLNLSVRAARCLQMRGIAQVGDLVSLTEADLLRGKNCGRRTVKELKALASSLGLSLNMRVPIWTRVDSVELARQHAVELSVIRQQWIKNRYSFESDLRLEGEVRSALAAVVKASDMPKVELWIGLDQTVPPTLEAVGGVADVTRERVRQIVEKAKMRIAAMRPDLPRLRAAVDILDHAFVLSERRARTLLIDQGLAAGAVSTRGLLRAAEVFRVSTRVEHGSMNGCDFVGVPEGLAALKVVWRAERRAVEQWGCSTIEDVIAQVNGVSDTSVTPETVREAMTAQSGFRWLDEESGWFWLEDVPRNRLLNKIDKILAVASKVDLAVLRAGIARHYRMEGFAPPRRVLMALCEQLKDCQLVEGRTVVDLRPRDPSVELSDQEMAMVKVFREHGPALSYADAIQKCTETGLNETTTSIYLANSPILRRVTLGVYTLVGAAVTPGEVESVARSLGRERKHRVIQDYGWRSDGGGVWATYKISEGMLRSGVVSVPRGIRRYLDSGGFELCGLDGSKIGRIGINESSMWGFLPFFRRRGGEAGDYLRVTFDVAKRVAQVELADETFDDTELSTDPPRCAVGGANPPTSE
jgi:hypothetical protein